MTRRSACVRSVCGAVLAACVAALAAAAEEGGWVLSKRDESPGAGYALYRRQAPGSEFSTWRLETELAAPAELVERATLRTLTEGPPVPPAGRRQRLLRREGNVFWIHTEIDVSLASDRDLILRIERRRDPATGVLRVEWRADPDAAPAPRAGFVRMRVSRGFWEFTPIAGGRTRAHYESYAEPGGPFPRWLVDVMSSGEVVDGLVQLRSALAEASHAAPPGQRPAVESAFGG
jgi:hypothetical protein